MEQVTIKCEACKNRILIENNTGIHLCPICDCKNEHYVFSDDLTKNDIQLVNKLFKDIKKIIRKNEIELDNIKIMDIAVSIIKENSY